MSDEKKPYYIPPLKREQSALLQKLIDLKNALGAAAPKLGAGATIQRPSDETMQRIKKP